MRAILVDKARKFELIWGRRHNLCGAANLNKPNQSGAGSLIEWAGVNLILVLSKQDANLFPLPGEPRFAILVSDLNVQ